MSDSKKQKRFLALDIHPRSFGYVVFEGPDRLLDWGVKNPPKGAGGAGIPLSRKLAALLDDFIPSVVVVREPTSRKGRKSGKPGRFLNTIRTQTKRRRIAMRVLGRRAVRDAFADLERINKDQIASALARRLPELAWQLPPERKIWKSEDYRMSIFGAAALGIAYFRREASREQKTPPNELAPP